MRYLNIHDGKEEIPSKYSNDILMNGHIEILFQNFGAFLLARGCENTSSVVDHQPIKVSIIPTKWRYKITLSFNDFSL
jgi:hypothetical protein